ncbi:MAG: YraN family protein [Candidatus Paceibacterota bacterium]
MYNKDIKNPTDRQIVGVKGEDLACKFIKDKGFKVIERNYYKKWGEIDIIVKKGEVIHFIEVKTVSREIGYLNNKDEYRPEDNIHPWKLQRLSRIIQSYLLEKDVSDETDWQFDVITVYLDKEKNLLDIDMLEDIIL